MIKTKIVPLKLYFAP